MEGRGVTVSILRIVFFNPGGATAYHARKNTDSRVLSDTEARETSPCGSIGSSMEQFEDVKIFLSPHFDQVFDGGYIGELGSSSSFIFKTSIFPR